MKGIGSQDSLSGAVTSWPTPIWVLVTGNAPEAKTALAIMDAGEGEKWGEGGWQ